MATRNDLIALAHRHLSDVELRPFLLYAEALDTAITGQVIVDLPRPIGALDDTAPPAEQLAWHTLSEERGSVWAAARSVVQLLRWDTDPRAFANGRSFTLGLFAKGGLRGLTRSTQYHANVCRLLNHMVSDVLPLHEWTSLTLTLDDMCEPYVDRGNREGRSLLVGLSNHDQGGIWIASQDGGGFAEVGDTIYAGDVFQTSAKAVTFDAKRCLHSTCNWTGGNRIVMIAYCVAHFAALPANLRSLGKRLRALGFATWPQLAAEATERLGSNLSLARLGTRAFVCAAHRDAFSGIPRTIGTAVLDVDKERATPVAALDCREPSA
ncbi:unnamed protein product [Symbiodinium sp. CCMP2592]|nr:unnamed protein product [Symbiodinium sp. CCMP2592]